MRRKPFNYCVFTSPLPVKCATCNSDDHAAWSMKCSKRPTAPIEDIPNVKAKCLNKRTDEVSDSMATDSRIHKTNTHDYIINKGKHQLNKTNNNREELIIIDDHNVDTSVVFKSTAALSHGLPEICMVR